MKRISATLCFLLALSVAFGATAAETRATAMRAPDTNLAVETQAGAPAPQGVSLGSTADQKRYAAREAAAPDAKNYKGGDVVVIGASAVAIILLVVLVLILI